MLNGVRGTSDRLAFMRQEATRDRKGPARDDACANVGVATADVLFGLRGCVCTGDGITTRNYYSITRCFCRHNRRDRQRHSEREQQHVARHNKRPMVSLNRNNTACALDEHSSTSGVQSRSIHLYQVGKKRINYKISVVRVLLSELKRLIMCVAWIK